MSRLYRATGDARMRDKAVTLMTEWAKTVKPDGDAGMRHYPYDKLVCGLVDLQLYTGHEPAISLLEKVTDFASKTLDRSNNLADPSHDTAYYGVPQEWYTLSENLFRAYQLTGNPKFKAFGEAWLYHAWWNKFARTSAPPDAHGVHAYSHVNTFSSAAMAYDVLGTRRTCRSSRTATTTCSRRRCMPPAATGRTNVSWLPTEASDARSTRDPTQPRSSADRGRASRWHAT